MTDVDHRVLVTVEAVDLGTVRTDGLDEAERGRVREASSAWVSSARAAGYLLVRATLAPVLGTTPAAVRLDRTCPTCGARTGVSTSSTTRRSRSPSAVRVARPGRPRPPVWGHQSSPSRTPGWRRSAST